jgi:hypothetical protein
MLFIGRDKNGMFRLEVVFLTFIDKCPPPFQDKDFVFLWVCM